MTNDKHVTDDRLIVVLTTVANRDQADQLAEWLLESSLAACVQVEGPIDSHYVWEGRRQREREFRLVIKTTSACWSRVQTLLMERHPYDEPQIVAVPVQDASEGYAHWVRSQTD